jgi:hypothetical protein
MGRGHGETQDLPNDSRRPSLVVTLDSSGREYDGDSEFDIYSNGTWKTRLQATGPLSALVKYGQENPEADPNAEWTVERFDPRPSV